MGANTVQKRIFLSLLPLIMTIYFNGSRHARIDLAVNRNSEPRELIFFSGWPFKTLKIECRVLYFKKVRNLVLIFCQCNKTASLDLTHFFLFRTNNIPKTKGVSVSIGVLTVSLSRML